MRCSCISSTIWPTHEDVTYQTQHLLETSTASKIHSLSDFRKRPDGQRASGGDQGQSRATGKEQKGSNSIILGGALPQQFLERSMKIPHFPRKFISITCLYLSDHRERHKKQKDSGGGQRRMKATGRFRENWQTLPQQFLERTMNYSPIKLEASTFSRH